MASRYSIIQYVPNPIADERINIGVLAFDEEQVKVHFLSRWDRVRCFGAAGDIAFLRDFAQEMQEAVQAGLLFPGDDPSQQPRHERLGKVAKGWINSIQFTEPCGSLASLDSLLKDITKTYLLEIVPEKRKLRDRQAAGRVATSHIRKVAKRCFGDDKAKELLRTDYGMTGERKQHRFDVTVANGRPFLAAHGISFEVQTPESLIDSLAFMILDVKESNAEFPLGIVALPPQKGSHDYKRLEHVYQSTIKTYEKLGAKVLRETDVEPWASEEFARVKV